MPFDDLFQQQFSFVWRCLRALGVCVADIDDVTQEVFMVAHRRLAEFQADQPARPWLYGILRNVVANHHRALRRSRAWQERFQQEPPQAPPQTPLDQLEAQEAVDLVTRTLQKLTSAKREVFLLVELEQLSVPEVATALEIPVNTAYSRLRLARAEFQAVLLRDACP